MSRPRYVWECTCGEKSEVIHNGVQAQKAAARHEDSNAFDMRDHTAEVRRVVAITCEECVDRNWYTQTLDEPRGEMLTISWPSAWWGTEQCEADPDCDDCGEPGKGTLRNGICSACRWEARHLQAGLRGGQ